MPSNMPFTHCKALCAALGLSVLAHGYYENGDPYEIHEPGGMIDQRAAAAQFLDKDLVAQALRRPVPLMAMCSRKWAMPFCSSRSCRPPAVTQMPALADCRPGMASVTMRKPLGRVVRRVVKRAAFRGSGFGWRADRSSPVSLARVGQRDRPCGRAARGECQWQPAQHQGILPDAPWPA